MVLKTTIIDPFIFLHVLLEFTPSDILKIGKRSHVIYPMGKPRIPHLPDERDLSRGILDFYSVRVKARSLLCFWSAKELGMSHTEPAKKLEMSLSNIGFSVERDESIAKMGNYSLEK